jgi:hypothetical protein
MKRVLIFFIGKTEATEYRMTHSHYDNLIADALGKKRFTILTDIDGDKFCINLDTVRVINGNWKQGAL